MHRILLLAVFCGLPALAGAQAVRCQDPATGRVLYTDQPCPGGELVVPKRSAAERREALAVQREQLRLESTRQADAAVRAPAVPAESDACRAARAEASFRAASRTASEEEIRTARANAALACGQPPPAEIVVVPPPPPPHVEVIGVAPYPGYIWIGGHWSWHAHGHRHHWVPGRWEAPRHGHRWAPHRWERHGDSWRERHGRWERHEDRRDNRHERRGRGGRG